MLVTYFCLDTPLHITVTVTVLALLSLEFALPSRTAIAHIDLSISIF